jgi:hypothetical protein
MSFILSVLHPSKKDIDLLSELYLSHQDAMALYLEEEEEKEQKLDKYIKKQKEKQELRQKYEELEEKAKHELLERNREMNNYNRKVNWIKRNKRT